MSRALVSGHPLVFDTLEQYSGYAQLVFAMLSSVTGHSFITAPAHLISLLPRAQLFFSTFMIQP